MKEGLNFGWEQEDKFNGTFNGYIINALKYVSPEGAKRPLRRPSA